MFDTLTNETQHEFVEVACLEYAAFVKFAHSEIQAEMRKKSVCWELRWDC